MGQQPNRQPFHLAHSKATPSPQSPLMCAMGGRFECPSSVLLCAEDESSIWCLDDDENCRGSDGHREKNDLCGESLMYLTLHSDDECIGLLASKETDHLPKNDYAKRLRSAPLILSSRGEAVEWIGKVLAYYNFGPTTAYLSVNYLDRFLSCYELPEGKEWMMQLLAVSCLSLAAKMDENLVPLSLDLQVCEPRFIFEAKTIQRMELLVLSTLEWRMLPVTPFSFVDYFLSKFSSVKTPSVLLLHQSFEVIKNVTKRIDFLEFRPSQIALAVALFVTSLNYAADLGNLLSSCLFVDRGRVMRCYGLIKDMAFLSSTSKCPSAFCMPQGRDSVNNSRNIMSSGSQLDSRYFSPEAKRRRLYGLPTS